MPYIGVRHVLKSAGLLKHQEQISSELGVETISDLIELREADLQQLGLQAHWPKFEAELKATLQSGAGKSKFAERRQKAQGEILAAGMNASAAMHLSLFLAAAGASLYADRLDALGTGAPSNFSGMLNFAVASANAGAPVGGGVGECGIQLVDLQVDRT